MFQGISYASFFNSSKFALPTRSLNSLKFALYLHVSFHCYIILILSHHTLCVYLLKGRHSTLLLNGRQTSVSFRLEPEHIGATTANL